MMQLLTTVVLLFVMATVYGDPNAEFDGDNLKLTPPSGVPFILWPKGNTLGNANSEQGPVKCLIRQGNPSSSTTYTYKGINNRADEKVIFGSTSEPNRIITLTNLGLMMRNANSASTLGAHLAYENEADREFDAYQSYNNLMADYHYDFAVEEARETRAIQRLQGKKQKAMRLKPLEKAHAFHRRTHQRF
eukprot:229611_1